MDMKKFKERLEQNSLSAEDVAKELSIDQSTYYRKVAAQGESFSVAQVKHLAKLLHLSGEEAAEIFLQ